MLGPSAGLRRLSAANTTFAAAWPTKTKYADGKEIRAKSALPGVKFVVKCGGSAFAGRWRFGPKSTPPKRLLTMLNR